MANEKLTPAIKEKVKEIEGILAIKDKNKSSQSDYLKRIDDAKTSIPGLQQKIDNAVLAGEKPDEHLRNLEVKKAEIQAFERHLQLLIDQADKVTQKEKTAKTELSKLVSEALTSLREDTRNSLSGQLKEVNATLAVYEQFDELNLCHDQSVNFQLWLKALGADVSPKIDS